MKIHVRQEDIVDVLLKAASFIPEARDNHDLFTRRYRAIWLQAEDGHLRVMSRGSSDSEFCGIVPAEVVEGGSTGLPGMD
jgi:hypothetical protein